MSSEWISQFEVGEPVFVRLKEHLFWPMRIESILKRKLICSYFNKQFADFM